MKKRGLILLPVLTFPLLMGNAPAPESVPEEVTSYEVSNIEIKDIDDKKLLAFDIKNTSESNFIIPDRCHLYLDAEDTTTYTQIGHECYEVIAPGKTLPCFATIGSREVDLSKIEFTICGLTDASEDYVKVTRFYDVEKNLPDEYVSKQNYTFSIDYEVTQNFSNRCTLYGVNFNGKDHYFSDYSINPKNGTRSFRFYSNEDVDPSTITLTKFYTTHGNSYYDKDHKKLANILLGGFAMFIGAIIVVPLLVVGLIFLIRMIVKKNKAKKASK